MPFFSLFLTALVCFYISFQFGTWFLTRVVFRGSERLQKSTVLFFGFVFATSCFSAFLLLCDIAGLLSKSVGSLCWLVVVSSVTVLVLLVAPFVQIYCLLGRRLSVHWKLLLALLLETSYIIAILTTSFYVLPKKSDIACSFSFYFESMTNLVAFTGTLVLGLLSGSCAISGAFDYWRKWTKKVSEEEITQVECKLFSVYQSIARKKESIALLDYEEKIRQYEEESSFRQNVFESSSGHSRLRALSRKLLAGLESWSTNAAKQRVGLLAECKAMEDLASRLFMEWNEKCDLWEFRQCKLYRRIYNTFGFVMICLCFNRMYGSSRNLLFGLQSDAEDSVTLFINVILKYFRWKVNLALLSQYTTFIFASCLIFSNFRLALLQTERFFCWVSKEPEWRKTQVTLWLSQSIAVYLLSSMLLVEQSLPVEYKLATGEIFFTFYQNWFDRTFLFSCLVTLLIMFFTSKFSSTITE
ncbi:hypothetical protein GpartN1_g732.t1 [Galdieria partita]|uniref:Uncharacterized protein n=1 Tax=Galdieria partita TaxID=83374 RepID=A0A9C7PSB3_9RHOD|nr:hypothetical protein GpartN1_g732.t1 [Galdieria partita]